jgi:ABC-2 type transport system permease protein
VNELASLQAGVRTELLLMLYRRKTLIFFLVSAILPVLLALSFHALQPVVGVVAVSSSFPIQILELYTLFMIPLFLFLAIADLFPQEVSARTLKLVLLRPITRFSSFMAKMLALGIAIAAIFLTVAAVSLVCHVVLGSSDAGSMDLLGYLKAYFAGFLSMWALSSLFILAAQFFRSASGFLMFSIVFYAAAKVIPFFVKGFSSFSLTAYTDWYVVWLNHSVSAASLVTSSLFVISAMVLFFMLGYLMFDRKEV